MFYQTTSIAKTRPKWLRLTPQALRLMAQPGLIVVALLWLLSVPTFGDDWPQWLGPQRDGIWRETGILDKFPEPGPVVRWRQPINPGYTGPAVANGRLFVMDRVKKASNTNSNDPSARGKLPGTERVLCLKEADGKLVWQYEYPAAYDLSYPAGPRTTPTVDHGLVFTLGAVGHLVCLEAATGALRWSRDLKKDYEIDTPTWGFAAHPLIDGQKLICMVRGQGTTVVAFDKDTGKEIWRALSANEPGYSTPMIYEAGGCRQLMVWHPEALNSLDPETGKVYWTQKFAARSGLTLATPRQMGDYLFVTCFYDGSLMMRLDARHPAATEVWRGRNHSERNTDGLHSIIATPFLENGYIYGVCSYGQFRCLKADTGERVWESLIPTGGQEARWANTFIVKNGDRFFLPNEKGDLIIARLDPQGYHEISRAHLLEPTNTDPGRPVVWSHPAFANRCVYMRNDKEIICVSLAAAPK